MFITLDTLIESCKESTIATTRIDFLEKMSQLDPTFVPYTI